MTPLAPTDPDTLLRLALAMWAGDPWSPCPRAQRAWLSGRLADPCPFTRAELQPLRAPLLAWYRQAHPRTAAVVAAAWEDHPDEERTPDDDAT